MVELPFQQGEGGKGHARLWGEALKNASRGTGEREGDTGIQLLHNRVQPLAHKLWDKRPNQASCVEEEPGASQ